MESVLSFINGAACSQWIAAITGLITGATALTILTPNKVDNMILNAVLKVLNVLAGNIGKNKNEDG